MSDRANSSDNDNSPSASRAEGQLDDNGQNRPESTDLPEFSMPSLTPSVDEIEQRQRLASGKKNQQREGFKSSAKENSKDPASGGHTHTSGSGLVEEASKKGAAVDDFHNSVGSARRSTAASGSRGSKRDLRLYFLLLVLVSVGFSTLALHFYQENVELKSEQSIQATNLEAYQHQLMTISKQLETAGTQSSRSADLLEKRLKSAETELGKMIAVMGRMQPDLLKSTKGLKEQQDLTKQLQAKLSAIESQTVSQQSFDKNLKRALGETEQKLERLVAEKSAGLEQTMKQGLVEQNKKFADQLAKVNQAMTRSEGEVVTQNSAMEQIEQKVADLAQRLEAFETRIAGLQELVSGQSVTEELESISLEMLQLENSIEKQLASQEITIKSINLFRRRVNSDIEQIQTEIRNLKGVESGADDLYSLPEPQ